MVKIVSRWDSSITLLESDVATTLVELINSNPRANLTGAYLTRANLAGAYLTRANLADANLTGAYLTGANLTGAYLTGANLTGAYLTRANLTGANLADANLADVDLTGANLADANLTGAYLTGANLTGAYLTRANLTGANLADAYLADANLTGANLTGVYLTRANLTGANLADVDLTDVKNMPSFSHLPEGSLIGWKKLQNGIIAKLSIPTKAKRVNSTGRKCRAEYVKVLQVIGADFGVSINDGKTRYEKGAIVKPDSYDPDFRIECSNGIHFFITREEAEAYS